METQDKPFVKEKQTVKIGENKDIELELPRLTLSKIMAVTSGIDKLVSTAREKSPQVFELFSGKDEGVNLGLELVKMLPSILPVIMNEMTSVIGAYLGKDKQWIEDNMDMEDLVAVATPFFASILQQGNHLTNALGQMFPTASPNPSSEQLES